MANNTRPQRLVVVLMLFLFTTLFLFPYSSALDSMSTMHSSSRCNLPGKQAQYPYVKWGAADVQAGISNLYSQFQRLPNSNDYVYCSLLGYLVIMIKTAFDKRQCGNGDSFCYNPPGGAPGGSFPDCTAYYCGKNPNAYCNTMWGNRQCHVVNNKCFLRCMKFKINWSTSGWSMFSNNFANLFWQVNGNLYWNKRDLDYDRNNTQSHLPPPDLNKPSNHHGGQLSAFSHHLPGGIKQSQDTRSEEERAMSKPMRTLKRLLASLPQRRMSRRQQVLSSCGECGCSWGTQDCSACDNGWLALGTPCVYAGLCCQCWMIA